MSMRDDDRLDALIDRVAHDLTAVTPPRGLAEHVRARIAVGDRAAWFVAWPLVAAVSALVVAIVLTTALWPGREADAPVVADRWAADTDGGSTSTSAEATADKPRDPPYVDTVQTGPAPTRSEPGLVTRPSTLAQGVPSDVEGRSEPAARSRAADGVTLAGAEGAAPLPGIELLTVQAIEDPVLVAEMSGLAMPIEIEPLQVAPLAVQ